MTTSRFVGLLLAAGALASLLVGSVIAIVQDADCPLRADPELCGHLSVYIPAWSVLLFGIYMLTALPLALVVRRSFHRRT